MKNDNVIKLLKIEKQCVERNSSHSCNRNCLKCDLVQNDLEIKEMYETAIKEIKFRIPKKPIGKSNLCPTCGMVEFGFSKTDFCDNCGQAIDWGKEEYDG